MTKPIEGKTVDAAKKLAQGLVESLTRQDIWCTMTEVHEPDLKFIKIEASIKVK